MYALFFFKKNIYIYIILNIYIYTHYIKDIYIYIISYINILYHIYIYISYIHIYIYRWGEKVEFVARCYREHLGKFGNIEAKYSKVAMCSKSASSIRWGAGGGPSPGTRPNTPKGRPKGRYALEMWLGDGRCLEGCHVRIKESLWWRCGWGWQDSFRRDSKQGEAI